MVAIAAHFAAMADGRTTYYTAPIKALVSEKFFALCEIFGAENVGMLDRRRVGQRRRADRLLHRRGAGEHRAARGRGRGHRPGRDGRVPLLRRAAARLGVAGAAALPPPGAVPAHVGHARRRRRALREDLTRRTAARRRSSTTPSGPCRSTFSWSRGAAARAARGARADRPGAGLRRALHAGLGAGARAVAALGQALHARGARRDRRRDRRVPLHRRLRQDAVASSSAAASASTTPGCCRATGAWSSSSRRPGC